MLKFYKSKQFLQGIVTKNKINRFIQCYLENPIPNYFLRGSYSHEFRNSSAN